LGPFEARLADTTGRISILLSPFEPYRHRKLDGKLKETRYPLYQILESIQSGQTLEDITLVKRAEDSPLVLWSFDVLPRDTDSFDGGGNGGGWQESLNRLKEGVESLLPRKPVLVPVRR
jgi:hypothetical protein